MPSVSIGTMRLTSLGKNEISKAMYHKGKSFIASFVLLKQHNGHPLVYIHLLCQGVEIIMKALLLMHDHDRYKNYIKREIGHDIRKSVEEVITVYDLRRIDPLLANELDTLTNYYKNQLLRYGSNVDILIDPVTISYDRTFRKTYGIIKLTDKKLNSL